MSCNLKNCLKKLEVVSNVKSVKLRKKLLKEISCDENVFKALQEIVINTINQNVPLDNKTKKKLRKYKKEFQAFTKVVKSKQKKKKLIQQSGGFLPAIIPAVLSILSAIV